MNREPPHPGQRHFNVGDRNSVFLADLLHVVETDEPGGGCAGREDHLHGIRQNGAVHDEKHLHASFGQRAAQSFRPFFRNKRFPEKHQLFRTRYTFRLMRLPPSGQPDRAHLPFAVAEDADSADPVLEEPANQPERFQPVIHRDEVDLGFPGKAVHHQYRNPLPGKTQHILRRFIQLGARGDDDAVHLAFLNA
ncbi:hypothetical protein SDC9_176497 [bioreactor metagenome]|uniref:Uncharacterized protein n=1 Tax=bioreactor metagenome TaxID=1076179 RepID=A0A645GTB4_9ZZZZ